MRNKFQALVIFFSLFMICLYSNAQIGIGASASRTIPMGWISDFYGPSWGAKIFFTPNSQAQGLRWNFGLGWTKFEPKAELFNAETRNGVKGDVSYSQYSSVPIFAEMEFNILERPANLFGGVNMGINFIRYTVDSRDPFGQREEVFNGVNMFFAPRLGTYLINNNRMAISLDLQYYATLNYKAAWLEDYVGLNLSFIIKTNAYL